MKDKIRQLISDDQLAEALQLLEPYNSTEVLGLRGRLARIEKQNRSGLISFDEYSRQQNQITAAALDILKKVPDGPAPASQAHSSIDNSQAEGLKRQLELTIGRQNALRASLPLAFDPNQRFSLEVQIGQLDEEIAALRAKLEAQPGGSGQNKPAQAPEKSDSASQAIYFSYAWGDDNESGESREEIVNQLYDSLNADGFTLKRDKMDLEYRGLISDFMKDIGRSGLIVVAVSDKYLRSPYCMHELFEIYRNGRQEKEEFSKRVFPIRAESIKMSDPMVLDDYLDYWEKQEEKWKDLITRRAGQLGTAHFGEYNKVKEINSNFAQLLAFLQDMNSMSKRLLAQEDFAPVKEAIRKRLAELAG
jgi:hypothetical protein